MATRVWFPQRCEEKRWWSWDEYSVNQKTRVIESETYYYQLYEEGSDRLGQKMSFNLFFEMIRKISIILIAFLKSPMLLRLDSLFGGLLFFNLNQEA